MQQHTLCLSSVELQWQQQSLPTQLKGSEESCRPSVPQNGLGARGAGILLLVLVCVIGLLCFEGRVWFGGWGCDTGAKRMTPYREYVRVLCVRA